MPKRFEKSSMPVSNDLLTNQPAGLAGDAEGVHQMRVAIRRLRAALALFQPFLEPHAAALFQDELRRIGRVFGEARDWDAFCLQILPEVLETERDAGWRDLLLEPATMARAAAHTDFVGEIRDPAFTRLVLGLASWTEELRLPGLSEPERPIEDLCPALLDRLAAKVARRGRQIRHRSEAELHALRKSLKKLRYGIHFLRPMFDPALLKPYMRDCKKLQQILGDINDTVAATALAERLAKGARVHHKRANSINVPWIPIAAGLFSGDRRRPGYGPAPMPTSAGRTLASLDLGRLRYRTQMNGINYSTMRLLVLWD